MLGSGNFFISAASGTICSQSARLAKCSDTPLRVELPEFTNSFGYTETAGFFNLFFFNFQHINDSPAKNTISIYHNMTSVSWVSWSLQQT